MKRGRGPVISLALLVGVFFGLYAALRSPDLTAVDGPFRSCEVYHHHHFFFHGNNHLLYPLNVWTWNCMLRPLFGPSPDAYAYARRTQLLNGLFVALSVGLMFPLTRAAGGAAGIAVGTAVAYGCSRAVILHGTNAAEPPVGLGLCFLAIAVAAVSRGRARAWLASLAGACLAAAMASYQTMILIGPAVLFLLAARTPDDGDGRRGPLRRVLFFFGGSALGTALLYGWAYSHQGITGAGELIRRFFTVDGGRALYGGWSASKLVNTPVGLMGNVFPVLPDDYTGLRNLWRDHGLDGVVIRLIVISVATLAASLALAVQVWRRWGELTPSHRLAFRVALVGLACTLAGPFYWQPTYDKMWLQPVAIILFLIGCGLAAIPPSRKRVVLSGVFAALLLIEVTSNAIWAIPQARREPPCVMEAREVEALLRPDDLVVYEWDGVSILYAALSGPARPGLCLPTAAQEHGPAVTERLGDLVEQARARNAKVYFLGVLDVPEETWTPFLGDRLGVPYHALDEFRCRSRPVKTYQFKGQPLTLRVYEPG
jgi:hypothetical protein